MQRKYTLAHLILVGVVALFLTPLVVAVDAQARIAFSSNRDGNSEIYVMDTDGGNQRKLTNNRHGDWSPSWSPDGKRIAFVSNRDGHVIDGIPTSDIYVMDADGGNQQNLTNNPPGSDWFPSWSPDGKRIAFVSDRDGPFNPEIYVMDADGGNQQRLTNNPPGSDWFPSWSPDGKRIVFSARREGHFENKFSITNEIYVMDADGGNQQRLTENRKNDWSPSWAPDGERIAFYSNRDGNWEIYVMDTDGGNQQNLTNHPEADEDPAWLNSPFSVSPSGKKFTMWGRLKQIDR